MKPKTAGLPKRRMPNETIFCLLNPRFSEAQKKAVLGYYEKIGLKKPGKGAGGRKTKAITLIIASNYLLKAKLLNENKTLKDIAEEMTRKGYKITPPTIAKINRFAKIISAKELYQIAAEKRKPKKRKQKPQSRTGRKRVLMTEEEKKRIEELSRQGKGATEIARIIGRSESGIRNYLM